MNDRHTQGPGEPHSLLRPTAFGRLFGSLSVRVCKNLLVCADLSYPDSLDAIYFLSYCGRYKMASVILAPPDHSQADSRLSLLRGYMRQHKQALIVAAPVPLARLDIQQRLNGADFILDKARRHSRRRRLPVLLLGTGSDLACALQKDETLCERIQVVAAGFSGWPKGGLPEGSDIQAWQMLLDSDVPITFAAADASAANLPATNPLFAQHFLAAQEPSGQASSPACPLRLQTPQGIPPIALSGLLAAAYLSVGGQATAYRRPVIGNDGIFLHGNGTDPLACQTCASEPRIHWIKTVNSAAFLRQFERFLAACAKGKL